MTRRVSLSSIRRLSFFLLIILISFFPQSFVPIPLMLRFGIAIALFVLWILLELPSFYINASSKAFKKGNTDSGWRFLKKASGMRFMLSMDDVFYIATMYIQYAEDMTAGMELLDRYIAKSSAKRNSALCVLKSMGLSRLHKYSDASELLIKTACNSSSDDSVYLNLVSMLFQQRKFDEGRHYFSKIDGNSLFGRDLIGMSLIEQGRMKEAYLLYHSAEDSFERFFPEFYIHIAQTELYYCNEKKAAEYVKKAEQCIFVKSSALTAKYVHHILFDLKTSSGRRKINCNPVKVMLSESYNDVDNEKEWIRPSAEDIKNVVEAYNKY